MHKFRPLLLTIILATCLAASPASVPVSAVDQGETAMHKAIKYFTDHQKTDGSFKLDDREPPALTGMVLRVMARDSADGAKTPAAKQAIAYLLATQKPDGGIYDQMIGNYSTALCISGLAAANDPALKDPIARAVGYLKGGQWSDAIAAGRGQKVDPNSPLFGGWNYGGSGRRSGRADLSNTAQVLAALKDAGVSKDDPAFQNAVKFASRLQNNSETNQSKWAGNDGGFIYNPGENGEGDSPAGTYTNADGQKMVRSYGSMTYAGLETMLYAGLSKDDPRVKAALTWIRSNWTLDEHPGMRGKGDPQAGVFYYYDVFARSLAAYGEPVITDKQGIAHDWRKELIAKLASLQKPDGSFQGTDQWMESDPMIASCLATAALQEALQDLKDVRK